MNAEKIALSVHYKGGGLSNAEIAVLLRVDASSVSRYLKQAEDSGWLKQRVQVRLPRDLDHAVRSTLRSLDLEQQLFNFFSAPVSKSGSTGGVRRSGFVVVKTAEVETDELALRMMGIEGARLLIDLLVEHERAKPTVLGVAWGRSTGGVVSALDKIVLPELPNAAVVALQGGVGRGMSSTLGSQYPDVLAERLALLFRCRRAPVRVTLPAYIDDATASAVREAGLRAIWKFIENDATYREAVSLYERLDLALVGIGGLEPGAWALRSGYLASPLVMSSLIDAGATGDIACRFFRDRRESPFEGWAGDPNRADIIRQTNLRAVGISLGLLRARVRSGARVIAVAGGSSGAKAAAIRAALFGGFVTDLVSDERTALAILGRAKAKGIRLRVPAGS